jgi:CubicO group peptidase (beta-lactamase class C family)
MAIEVRGFCDERFAPLKEAFVANFQDGFEVGASLALLRHGQPMVDVWAGHMDAAKTRPWGRDTIVPVASLTKIATATCLLILIDRGLVDLDATVASYWPEFAQGGKGHVTVREAMSHRSGVPGLDPPVSFEAQRDWQGFAERIAAEPHWFEGESRLCYHFSTYGLILGEIVRRIDGRRPAQFFREEVAQPAGIDFQIGLVSKAERARVAEPCFLGQPPLTWDDPLAARAASTIGPGDTQSWDHQRSERPSGGGYANARSIARLAGIFGNGGALDGDRYLSKAIVDEASREQVLALDPFFGQLSMGLGFGLDGDSFPAPTPTSFHWGGAGGHLLCADQESGIGFGYALNNLYLSADLLEHARFQRLWGALGDVIGSL